MSNEPEGKVVTVVIDGYLEVYLVKFSALN